MPGRPSWPVCTLECSCMVVFEELMKESTHFMDVGFEGPLPLLVSPLKEQRVTTTPC